MFQLNHENYEDCLWKSFLSVFLCLSVSYRTTIEGSTTCHQLNTLNNDEFFSDNYNPSPCSNLLNNHLWLVEQINLWKALQICAKPGHFITTASGHSIIWSFPRNPSNPSSISINQPCPTTVKILNGENSLGALLGSMPGTLSLIHINWPFCRFPNQNQVESYRIITNRRQSIVGRIMLIISSMSPFTCWEMGIDGFRCIQARGEDFAPCKQFWRAYHSLCPGEWVFRIQFSLC